ncbi:hypothetical protein KXW38_000825, partial [Aspergillus fumigatus]
QRLLAFHGDDNYIGMDFADPPVDFAGVAASLGLEAIRVSDPGQLNSVLSSAFARPGTKLIVGDGPARRGLERKYPQAIFLGARHGRELADIYAACDVFVFPSKTDTFGLVLLEALASGLPIAAFPVKGPRDVIGSAPVAVLSDDLQSACMQALGIPREACVEFAATHTWEASARVFIEHAR